MASTTWPCRAGSPRVSPTTRKRHAAPGGGAAVNWPPGCPASDSTRKLTRSPGRSPDSTTSCWYAVGGGGDPSGTGPTGSCRYTTPSTTSGPPSPRRTSTRLDDGASVAQLTVTVPLAGACR